jgi:outer membrane protein assembly factor BamA
VEPSVETNPDTRDKLLTYRISEGPRYIIVQIDVAGNTSTSAKVIKRTSGLGEYQWYNPEKVLDAQQKLYATGLFQTRRNRPLDSGTVKSVPF